MLRIYKILNKIYDKEQLNVLKIFNSRAKKMDRKSMCVCVRVREWNRDSTDLKFQLCRIYPFFSLKKNSLRIMSKLVLMRLNVMKGRFFFPVISIEIFVSFFTLNISLLKNATAYTVSFFFFLLLETWFIPYSVQFTE